MRLMYRKQDTVGLNRAREMNRLGRALIEVVKIAWDSWRLSHH